MNNKSSGGGGFIAIGAIIAGLIACRFTLPGIFNVVKWIGIIAVIVIAVIIVLAIVLASKVSNDEMKQKKTQGSSLSEEHAEVLAKGRENLMVLRRSVLRIKSITVRNKTNEVCGQIDRIMQTLKDKPQKINSARRVFNYYLPTLGNVLQKYQTLESNGIPGDEKEEVVIGYLDDIKRAMDKLYANLFAEDVLDMTVDMEAMTMAVKRDGLLDNQGTDFKEAEKDINLTI